MRILVACEESQAVTKELRSNLAMFANGRQLTEGRDFNH